MSEVDKVRLSAASAIERSRERRRPIGTKSMALRRQHLARKIGRIFLAGGAVLIAAAIFGMVIQPLGFAGVMAVTLLLVAVAFLFDYTQRYYSDKICLLEGAGGSGVDLMHRISSKDALLAVSLSPYAVSTQRTVKLAHAAGASIVAITDTEASPVARKANVAILLSAQSPSFFDTISPALAAAEILVALLASRAGPDVPKKVREHERHLQAAGVFWNSTKRGQNDSE